MASESHETGISSIDDTLNSVSREGLDPLDQALFPAVVYPATLQLVLVSSNGGKNSICSKNWNIKQGTPMQRRVEPRGMPLWLGCWRTLA